MPNWESFNPSIPLLNFPKWQRRTGPAIPGRYPLGSYGDGIAHAIPELALRGEVKAGFVYHYNPLRTNPNPKRVIAGYKKLDLLVAIDTVLSETASIAHYVLPGIVLSRADRSRGHETQREEGAGQPPATGGQALYDITAGDPDHHRTRQDTSASEDISTSISRRRTGSD